MPTAQIISTAPPPLPAAMSSDPITTQSRIHHAQPVSRQT